MFNSRQSDNKEKERAVNMNMKPEWSPDRREAGEEFRPQKIAYLEELCQWLSVPERLELIDRLERTIARRGTFPPSLETKE